MNIGHYAKRILSIAGHILLGLVGFAVCYFLIRIVLSLLVFIPYEVRHIITSLLAAVSVAVVIFFLARTEGINESFKRHSHPIVTVVCNIVAAVIIAAALYKGSAVFEDVWFDTFQSITVPIAVALGDIIGYVIGCRLSKTAYSKYISPTNDDPIERPGKERSWRDSIQ